MPSDWRKKECGDVMWKGPAEIALQLSCLTKEERIHFVHLQSQRETDYFLNSIAKIASWSSYCGECWEPVSTVSTRALMVHGWAAKHCSSSCKTTQITEVVDAERSTWDLFCKIKFGFAIGSGTFHDLKSDPASLVWLVLAIPLLLVGSFLPKCGDLFKQRTTRRVFLPMAFTLDSVWDDSPARVRFQCSKIQNLEPHSIQWL